MKPFRPPAVVLWIAAAILLAGGTAYIGRGLWLPWQTDQDIDLKLRNDEYAIFAERIYPHGLVATAEGHHGITNYTVYPPYAFAIFTPLFSPPGYKPDRALFQILSVGALALMAIYGARTLRFAGPAAAALGAALPLAFSGNFVALCQGQFSIITTGLIVAQLMLLEKGRPVTAGLCWALAMLKPQIGAAFALLFLVGPRRNISGLFSGAAALLVLSASALLWTGSSPENVIVQGLLSHRLGHLATQEHAAGMWMAFTGLTPIQASAAIGAVLIIAAAAIWLLGRRVTEKLPLEQTAAICAALGYAGFYHVHYDNMMLFPLLLALVTAALSQGSIRLALAAASVALIAYPEPGLVMGLAAQSAVIRWTIFLVPLAAAVVLLAGARRTRLPAAR